VQDLDRERRALEFALSDRELVNVRKQMEEVRLVVGALFQTGVLYRCPV